MNSIFKKVTTITVITSMISVMLVVPFSADELSDAQNRKDELEAELEANQAIADALIANASDLESVIADIDSQVYDIEQTIAGYAYEVSLIQAEVDELQAAIDEKQVLIDEKQADIDDKALAITEKESDIADKETAIADKQTEIDEQYSYMSLRIQYMYENMDNLYIEALFTTETFGEAMTKVQYLGELNDYNKSMMDKLAELKGELEEQKTELEDDKKTLEDDVAALEDEKAVLQEEQDSLAVDRDYVLEKLAEAQALQDAQTAQQAVINGMRSAVAEELGYVYGAIAENEATGLDIWSELWGVMDTIESLTTAYEEQVSEGTSETYLGGMLCWPLPGQYGVGNISSYYGYRTHPVTGVENSFHCGLDIWCPQGTPIFACASGVVVAHQYDPGAGNWTVIYHGNGMYTEYMHQDYLGGVYVGQEVSAGEWIGAVGTTGSSTGYHLHVGVAFCYNGYFEGSGRVDPAPYLGVY